MRRYSDFLWLFELLTNKHPEIHNIIFYIVNQTLTKLPFQVSEFVEGLYY